ncbi:MAG TPA: prefoldin subunit alpha [archaeon]|nr:prefoldin subunit alpha [archaeon]
MEQDIQLKAAQVDYLNQQIKALQMQLMEMEKTVEELSILRVGLQNIEGVRQGDDVLVPLGASVYAKGQMQDVRKVIVNVGAGIFVEKTINDALPMVDRQLEQVARHEELIIQNITLLNSEAEKLTQELNQVLMGMRDAGLPA